MAPEQLLPTWAPRVPKARIRRLYETDARGVCDEELIDPNLIEGRMGDVVAFLDGLSCGAQSTPGLGENRRRWNEGLDEHRDWYPSRIGRDG
ncbi:MAG: hypothetical protein AB1505_05855 [Candidatus Latescibacterota bacterium]